MRRIDPNNILIKLRGTNAGKLHVRRCATDVHPASDEELGEIYRIRPELATSSAQATFLRLQHGSVDPDVIEAARRLIAGASE